jgi:hypothetical protein
VIGGAADKGEGIRVRDAVLGARRRVERDPKAGAEVPGVTTAGAVDGRARRDLVMADSPSDSGVVGGEIGGRDWGESFDWRGADGSGENVMGYLNSGASRA